MMKKWSKVTLLAAATAFMLAGVTACFTSVNDDDSSTNPGGSSGDGTSDTLTAKAATVSYLVGVSSGNALVLTASNSDESVVTGGELSGEFLGDDGGNKPTLVAQTKVASSGATGYQLIGSDSTSYTWTSKEIAYFTFTLTAKSKCKIDGLTAQIGSGQTGNTEGIVYFGDSDEVNAGGTVGGEGADKNVVYVDVAPSNEKVLAAGESLTVKIALKMKDTKALTKAGNGTKVVVGNIVVKATPAE